MRLTRPHSQRIRPRGRRSADVGVARDSTQAHASTDAGRLTQIKMRRLQCAIIPISEWSPGPTAFTEGGRGPSESSGRGWRSCPGPTFLGALKPKRSSSRRSDRRLFHDDQPRPLPLLKRRSSRRGLAKNHDRYGDEAGGLRAGDHAANQRVDRLGWRLIHSLSHTETFRFSRRGERPRTRGGGQVRGIVVRRGLIGNPLADFEDGFAVA
jgi:hypothetical protein